MQDARVARMQGRPLTSHPKIKHILNKVQNRGKIVGRSCREELIGNQKHVAAVCTRSLSDLSTLLPKIGSQP